MSQTLYHVEKKTRDGSVMTFEVLSYPLDDIRDFHRFLNIPEWVGVAILERLGWYDEYDKYRLKFLMNKEAIRIDGVPPVGAALADKVETRLFSWRPFIKNVPENVSIWIYKHDFNAYLCYHTGILRKEYFP